MTASANRLKNLSLSLPLLLFPAMFTAAMIVTLVFTPVLSYCYPAFDNMLISTLAGQLEGQEIKRSTTLSLCETFGLAWLYVSDGNARPLLEFAPVSPALLDSTNVSRKVKYHNREYFEAVSLIDRGRFLHGGLSLGGTMGARGKAAISNPLLWVIMPLRGGTLIAILLFATALLEILIWTFLTRPIEVLREGISDMTRAGSIDLKSYDSVRLPGIVVSEVAELKAAMRAIFVYLEKVKQDVINEQERLTRWKKAKGDPEAQTVSAPEPVVMVSESAVPKEGLSRLQQVQVSSASYAAETADSVLRAFPELVDGVIFVREALDEKHSSTVVTACNITSTQREKFERADLGPLLAQSQLTSRLVDLGPLSLKRFGAESLLADSPSRHIVVAPIVHKRNALGYLLVLSPQPLLQSVLAFLERVCNSSAGIYFGLLLSEEAEEQKWTEPLTALRNRAYLNEMLGHMSASIKAGSDEQFAVASFCLSLDPSQLPQSEAISAALLEKVAPTLRQIVANGKKQALSETLPSTLQFEIIKGQGLEFVMTASHAERKSYQALVQIIGRQIEPYLSMVSPPAKFCLGISLYPGAGETGEVLLSRSRAAMYFAEEHEAGPIAMLKAESVPADFRPSRRMTAMRGELGVLDCTELLQSIAGGTRSGTLVVEDGFGKEFVMTVAYGKPIAATIGGLSGQDAVVELVVTFNAGTFQFIESAEEDGSTSGRKLPPLAGMLMESAMAQDYYQAARGVLKHTDRPVSRGPNLENWTTLIDRNDVTDREIAVMNTILSIFANEGALSLEKVFTRLENCPTHIKWRSAALLQSYGAIAIPQGY